MAKKLIPITTRVEVTAVKREDILCITSKNRYIIIYTAEREYCFSGKLADLMPRLDGSFYKCHMSWIVNMDKVVSIRNGAVYFASGRAILLGKNALRAMKKQYIRYVEEQWEAK